ncbi:MAG TPA: type II toxin-antitoxin system RelE/ParE family toxin [Mucilaginibacter sp.]|jgi:toxin YoeB
MAKKIKWSARAQQERFEILDYWANRNKSKFYSIKLNQLFLDNIELVSKTPELGKPTKYPLVRIKIVRDYLIYYQINSDSIEIITIWDSRRNPKNFRL